jgi:hypothetical protein
VTFGEKQATVLKSIAVKLISKGDDQSNPKEPTRKET